MTVSICLSSVRSFRSRQLCSVFSDIMSWSRLVSPGRHGSTPRGRMFKWLVYSVRKRVTPGSPTFVLRSLYSGGSDYKLGTKVSCHVQGEVGLFSKVGVFLMGNS